MELKVKSYLKEFRSRRNMSQAELARQLNVTRQAVHGFETGAFLPSLEVAAEIGNILQVPASCIFSSEVENMRAPIALIVDSYDEAARAALAADLREIVDSSQLQSVVKTKEGQAPVWSWDPRGEDIGSGKPLGIAVACTSRKQFDELCAWFQTARQPVDCGIGMDRFPTIAYFAADWKYAREKLPDWELVSGTTATPFVDINNLVFDTETETTIYDAFAKAEVAAQRFSQKCFALGAESDGQHYVKMAENMHNLGARMRDGARIRRWSSEYALLVEALHCAEVEARNVNQLGQASKLLKARQNIERQA